MDKQIVEVGGKKKLDEVAEKRHASIKAQYDKIGEKHKKTEELRQMK